MESRELTDQQWQLIKRFIPPPPKRGRPLIDARRVLRDTLRSCDRLQVGGDAKEILPSHNSMEEAQEIPAAWSMAEDS
ncbi:MAG: hypothetical protein DRJ43_01125 [Thermoprotei archaeon]|nr:MAG: hypothetical protein DRJ43_01125 [Thermoprotei archaeon]